MPCYHPLTAWRGKGKSLNGKMNIVWKEPKVLRPVVIKLPCGQCIGCRLERSRQWAVRCVHESELYDKNCFITLTYSDDKLPLDGSVDVREFQLFMKRLRKYAGDHIRFFHCGEYGDKFGRPHYHAIIFNYDFDDKTFREERNGSRYYTSKSLDSLWGNGIAVIGEVTFESIAYVARYVLKKVNNDKTTVDRYGKVHLSASEHYGFRRPEYVTMSRRPGIGHDWFSRFRSDVYPHDNVVIRGVKVKPPKYYDGLFELYSKEEFDRIKKRRKMLGMAQERKNDSIRLRDKEMVKEKTMELLKRGLEETI